MAPAKSKKAAKAAASQEEDVSMEDAPVAMQEDADEDGGDAVGEDQAPPEDEDTLEQRITVVRFPVFDALWRSLWTGERVFGAEVVPGGDLR